MNGLAIAWMLAVGSVGLPSVDERGLPELIRQHQGEVVVLNFWATWCGPCREEFPLFVDLDRSRRGDGLAVVTVSMDEPEDVSKAQAFLKEQGADFPSYIRGFDDFEAFVNAIDPAWTGALPATFIFDRTGKLRFRQIGEVTKAQLTGAVQPLLKE